jgi:hypothetical protein
MWAMISRWVLRLAALRWLFKLGGLGLLLPIALLLKAIGLPLLAILAAVALPILILLFLFGLPIFLVLIFGAVAMGLVGMVLTIGVVAIKIGLFVVLPVWLIWKFGSMVCGRFCKRGGTNPGTSTSDFDTGSASGPTSGAEPA